MSVQDMKLRTRAFVFMEVRTGKEKQVLEKLMKLSGVIESHIVAGQYDILRVWIYPEEFLSRPIL